jgi:putative transposase
VTSPDLIGRDFTADAPGTRMVGDITYLRTGEGWLYLGRVAGGSFTPRLPRNRA